MKTRRVTDLPRAKNLNVADETPVAIADEQLQQMQYTTVGELRRTYSHRNGETEAPTIVGQYWFKGTFFGGTSNFDVADQVGVIAADNFGLMALCPLEYYEDTESFRGQWWGPIVPPWQSED